MVAPSPSLIEAVIALANKMVARARADFLPPSHPMVYRARELNQAYIDRFVTRPPDIAQCQFIDYYIRAYAAWHTYTGED